MQNFARYQGFLCWLAKAATNHSRQIRVEFTRKKTEKAKVSPASAWLSGAAAVLPVCQAADIHDHTLLGPAGDNQISVGAAGLTCPTNKVSGTGVTVSRF